MMVDCFVIVHFVTKSDDGLVHRRRFGFLDMITGLLQLIH